MTSEALLVDITDNVNNVNNGAKHIKNRGRNSFYSLPKTLSEDDDPFGLFQDSKERKQQSVTDDLIITKCSTVAEEPCTGLLVQIETESPKISESFQSVSSRLVTSYVNSNPPIVELFLTFQNLRYRSRHVGSLRYIRHIRTVNTWSIIW